MKTSKRNPKKLVLPAFQTEADEAKWWFENRKTHGDQMLESVRTGKAEVMTKANLLQRLAASKKGASPVVALRIPEADLTLARKQAAQKGLPYQTYIKSILHETLTTREKQSKGR